MSYISILNTSPNVSHTENCVNLLNLMLFQTCMTFFCWTQMKLFFSQTGSIMVQSKKKNNNLKTPQKKSCLEQH